VPQDSFLFSDTIANNIRFGRPDATAEAVEHAAKLANVHAFVSAKPEGYATRIQEGASNLSVGQRQLVCIARHSDRSAHFDFGRGDFEGG
jgi:ABC-type multidrug transport system fused ATPase/permease subunit